MEKINLYFLFLYFMTSNFIWNSCLNLINSFLHYFTFFLDIFFLKKNFIGNIGNPLVNRWGLNLFWYHFWNSKKNYNSKFQQDRLLKTLLNLYLRNGVDLIRNPSWNSYFWYHKNFEHYKNQYFRWEIFTQQENSMFIRYRFRKTYNNFYQINSVILRYSEWFLVIFQWYISSGKKKQIRDEDRYFKTKLVSKQTTKLKGISKRNLYFFKKTNETPQNTNFFYTF